FRQAAAPCIEAKGRSAKELTRLLELGPELRDGRLDAHRFVDDDGDALAAALQHHCALPRHLRRHPPTRIRAFTVVLSFNLKCRSPARSGRSRAPAAPDEDRSTSP